MINPEEAKRHALSLDNALDKLEEGIRASTIENIMKTTIDKIKLAVVKIAPYKEEVKEMSVLKAIKDTSCMALMLPDSDQEEQLEVMMPVEAPDPKDILSKAKELGHLTKEQKELMGELINELKLAQESLAQACSTLGVLSRSLNSKQLLLTLQASVRPLIQLNTLGKVLERTSHENTKNRTTRRHSPVCCPYSDSRHVIQYYKERKGQQPNQTFRGHTGLQTTKKIWTRNNTKEYARAI